MQAEDVGPNTFNTIAREISQMSGFPIVTIELCDFERAMMSIRGSHGFLPGDLPTPFEMPMDVTFSGEVAQTGKTLVETQAVTSDAQGRARVSFTPKDGGEYRVGADTCRGSHCSSLPSSTGFAPRAGRPRPACSTGPQVERTVSHSGSVKTADSRRGKSMRPERTILMK